MYSTFTAIALTCDIVTPRRVPVLNESDTLTYRECRAPAPLSGVVECLWRRERWRAPTRDLGVLPDGRVDMIWASDGSMVVIGPQTRSLMRPLAEDVVVVGVRFWPGIGPALLGVSAHELADLHV